MVVSHYEDNLWLSQFSHSPDDKIVAQTLLNACYSIGSKHFTDDLSFMINNIFRMTDKVAFFVERELKKNKGTPQRMYKIRKIKVPGKRRYKRQSYGAALQAVYSKRLTSQGIGSEGVIANFLTKKIQYNRYRNRFFLQPTIEEIRKQKINNIVIVSDLIGTGQRIIDMIESLWKSETIKSWHSLKFVKISILCYACTEKAEIEIAKHNAGVKVFKIISCPTIDSEFNSQTRDEIVELCQKYGSYSDRPLGYQDSGILMSFAHSIPNNCPAILGESFSNSQKTWNRLFRVPYQFGGQTKSKNQLYDDIEKNIYIRLDYEYMPNVLKEIGYNTSLRKAIVMIFLLDKGVRNEMDLIAFTKAPLDMISSMIKNAKEYDFIKSKGFQLKSQGKKHVQALKKKEFSYKKMVESNQPFYYPQSLRAPKTGV